MFIRLMTERDIERIREEEREKMRQERFTDDRFRDVHQRIDSICNHLRQLEQELHPAVKGNAETACVGDRRY